MRPILPAFNPAELARAESRIKLYQSGKADGFSGNRPKRDLPKEDLDEYLLGYRDAIREAFWMAPIFYYWKSIDWLERHRHWWHWS